MLTARALHGESLPATSGRDGLRPAVRVMPAASKAVPGTRSGSSAGCPSTLGGRLVWLRAVAAREPMPSRLHARGVEPDSVLGSPELAPAFRRYINVDDYEREQREDGCYIYPLHAALSRLRRGGASERARPLCADAISEVIRAGFDWRRVADRPGYAHEVFELFLSGAIRLLYDQYSFRPLN